MVAITTAAAISTVANAIPPFAKTVTGIFNSLAGEVKDNTNVSLTSYVKSGRIMSRVFIDASIAQDPVTTDILKTVHTQYCAFILIALQMSQLVSKSQNVQDILRVVATEDSKIHEDISGEFAMEVMQSEPANNKKTTEQVSGKVVSFAGDNHIPSGKVIEVTMTNPENPEHKVTVNIFVQLTPYIVPADLAVLFVVKDKSPTFYQRWIQWRTGEIAFFKDLILQCDRAKTREKLLKMDPSGAAAAMIQAQTKSRWAFAANLSKESPQKAHNIANTVLIFSQETMDRAKVDGGIDFSDYRSRQDYFNSTYALMIVVVDQMYNQVTIYYNSIEEAATYSFDQMQSATKNGSSTDLVSIMNALNQGRTPKF